MMFVKPIYYLKIVSETDIMCLWEIVHAIFGTVGITIDANECIYILLKGSFKLGLQTDELDTKASMGGMGSYFITILNFLFFFFKTIILFYVSYFHF